MLRKTLQLPNRLAIPLVEEAAGLTFEPSNDYVQQITERQIQQKLACIAAETSRIPSDLSYSSILNRISWQWLNLESALRSVKHSYRLNAVPANGYLDPSFANDNTILCLTKNGSLITMIPSGPDLHYECLSLCPDILSTRHTKLEPSSYFESVRLYSTIRPRARLSTSAILTSEIIRIHWKSGLDRSLVDRMKETATFLRSLAEESVKASSADAA